MLNQLVILRTRYAGVHVGILKDLDAELRVATLTAARRLWRWSGANTLNEVALRGVDSVRSRLSEPVEEIKILDVCEVIPVAPEAARSLTESRWPA